MPSPFAAAARALAAVLLVAAPLAYAGPPFLTGDPDTVDARHWEISIGAWSERRPGQRLDALPAFELNYGVAEGLEASVESAWLRARADRVRTEKGWENVVVGLKWRVLEEEKDGLSFAVKPEISIRNASSARKGLADDDDTILLDLRVQKAFGPWQVGAAAAPAFASGGGSNGWNYGAFLKHESGHNTIGIEVNGAKESAGGSNLLLNLGAQVQLVEWGKLLVGIGRELRNTEAPKLTSRVYVGWQLAF